MNVFIEREAWLKLDKRTPKQKADSAESTKQLKEILAKRQSSGLASPAPTTTAPTK